MPFLPPPDPGIEISIANTGMSKDISQTDGIQIVGRGELAFGGVYLSTLAKNLDSPSTEGEFQAAAGGRFKLHKADINVSVAYKRWLDTTGNPDEQAAEFSVSASQAFGQVTPRAQLIYSPDDLGSTSYSIYGEAGIGWKPIRDLMLSANLGRRIRGNALNYASANIGIAYTVHRNFTADLRLFDTNRSNVDEPYKRRLVGSIRAKL